MFAYRDRWESQGSLDTPDRSDRRDREDSRDEKESQERKEPAAIRALPAKGAGKTGRHSRALFPSNLANGYTPAASTVVATPALGQIRGAASATIGEVSEMTISWGLLVAEFLS